MALEAPLHLERLGLHDQRHLVHPTMAALAAHPFGDVDSVIEVDVVRQVVDPRPLDRLAGPVAFADRGQHRALIPDQVVAVHARCRRRNSGERRILDTGVAVEAADAEGGRVVIVAERNRLSEHDALAGVVGGPVEQCE